MYRLRYLLLRTQNQLCLSTFDSAPYSSPLLTANHSSPRLTGFCLSCLISSGHDERSYDLISLIVCLDFCHLSLIWQTVEVTLTATSREIRKEEILFGYWRRHTSTCSPGAVALPFPPFLHFHLILDLHLCLPQLRRSVTASRRFVLEKPACSDCGSGSHAAVLKERRSGCTLSRSDSC